MASRVPFIRPSMPPMEELSEDLASIVRSNWFSNFGPFEIEFRREIADFLQDRSLSVVTVNNATTGLMAALAATMPRGDGEKTIAIASFTFAAGAQAILWHGYRPAWIDIDAETLQPSISSLLELASKDERVAGILLTNTFGIGNRDVAEWESLARDIGIPLIIDSAAGFGSTYPGNERLGARGDCEVFSFHATKPFAIGEGGAITTRNPETAERMREFTNFGFHGSEGSAGIGLNGKLQELNAAIGRRQLATFENTLISRKQTLGRYMASFEDRSLRFPADIESSSICFASIVLDNQDDVAPLLNSLTASSVEARTYYSPLLHNQPLFQNANQSVSLAASESIASRVVSLPVLPQMSEEEVAVVVDAVRSVLQ